MNGNRTRCPSCDGYGGEWLDEMEPGPAKKCERCGGACQVDETPAVALHRDIMNLPCEVPQCIHSVGVEAAYKWGHEDARRAAAELALALEAEGVA